MSDKTKNFFLLLLANILMILYLAFVVENLLEHNEGYANESMAPSTETANQMRLYIIIPFFIYLFAIFYLFIKGTNLKTFILPITMFTIEITLIYLGNAKFGTSFVWFFMFLAMPFAIALLFSLIVGIIMDVIGHKKPKENGFFFLTFDTDNKISEVNIAKIWNTKGTTNEEFGGFLFMDAKDVIYYLDKGNMVYNAEIPNDAEVFEILDSDNPHTMYRCNKIILSNPRQITDDIAMSFYRVANMASDAYYHAMAVCAVMGYDKTANQILSDMVTMAADKKVYAVWQKYIKEHNKENCNETVTHIGSVLDGYFQDN